MEDTTKNLNGVIWWKVILGFVGASVTLIAVSITNNLVINPFLSKLNWQFLSDLNRNIPLMYGVFTVFCFYIIKKF